ncbi:MAG: D-cysteine desulfhydrase family protein [Chloroflexi bacterium]|nr:D-cysteine desulfhydrase family protein [Chloroflexota bacterium]
MPLENMRRVRLAHLPTPLDDAPRLSRELGARILVKRDDLTGLAFGGNKTRKLEFLVADALRQGCDTLITEGATQSNHCRQTVAAARKVGLRCVLVLSHSEHDEVQGNLLLDQLMDADIRLCARDERDDLMQQVMQDEQRSGRKPYAIPTGGSNATGALGYASLVLELAGQLFARGEGVSRIYFSSSSGGTHAGLLLGAKLYHAPYRVIGVSPDDTTEEIQHNVARIASEGAALLGVNVQFTPDEIEAYDQFVGHGYAVSTPESREAIRLFAQQEGILLDPVYTAKAAAGMLQDIRSGDVERDETILFIHTGGTPALFAYHQELQA